MSIQQAKKFSNSEKSQKSPKNEECTVGIRGLGAFPPKAGTGLSAATPRAAALRGFRCNRPVAFIFNNAFLWALAMLPAR
jgi:hypothetical protein